ncbi:MAG: UbiD family decarboxylase [Planctomycetota bacterium]
MERHLAPLDQRAFLATLRAAGELVEVEAPVDTDLEIAEIHRRVIAANGPALLFKRPRGKAFPVVTNLFGTARRVELAFGTRPLEVVRDVARIPEELLPPTPGRVWAKRGLFRDLLRVGLGRKGRGPVTEHIDTPPRLSRLPALRTWARDGGPFVTLPLVLTQSPVNGATNLGMYRAQVFDDDHVGLHCQIGKGGGFHLQEAQARGLELPVAIHVGGPPAAVLAAIAPLPEHVPELLLASLCLGRKLDLATSRATPLAVMARSEFVIAGRAQPGARRPEGPFGDHYGYYSETHDYPFMRVDALLRREGAVWPATVVGKPRQEDFFLGDFLQELLLPLAKVAMPGVLDLWSYGETGYHSLAAAVVRERYKREAMTSAFRILGEGQLSLTKFLLATDRAVDLRDFPALLRHVLARADFRTDLFVLSNLSMDSLDYAGPKINEGSKGVLLGLGDPIRALPAEFTGAPRPGVRAVRVFTEGALAVDVGPWSADDGAAQRVADDPAFADWPLIVLTDDAARATKSAVNFLWTTFTRFDPARDLVARRVDLIHHHAAFTPPLVIDARMKAWYPEELFCDPETSALVDRRWTEYFPSGRVAMGDSARGHLD